ncbi:hypothetical protein AB0L63_04995 [Nocardia sp. NPDC051990]|uniref:hypothetical protein n=1 Tax=Nocardia sp. NPDC051990 TaxID=3155285 RepID=UPI00342F81F7
MAAGAILISTIAADCNGRAERIDGGFRVSARKPPASGGEVGDVVATVAADALVDILRPAIETVGGGSFSRGCELDM